MVRVSEIKIEALENKEKLPARLEHRLHLPGGTVESICITKESIDARQKPNIFKVYSFDVKTNIPDVEFISICKDKKVKAEIVKDESFCIPKSNFSYRPVVVGSGPCGMFAALVLAKAGACPIVLERGSKLEERVKAVESFWNTGKLDTKSNAQFGEGGAGTFSDGKLTTGTKSIYQRFILESFVKAGADPEILYKQKAHIGTDVLRKVVVNIRKEIEELGGEYLFDTQLLDFEEKDGNVLAAITSKGKIETKAIILATGHSARDTVRSLYSKGLNMNQKQFSMGVRIEHDQNLIDHAQYGNISKEVRDVLGPADYKLNTKASDGRGVYTFCMCPGGEVVNASSHEGMVVCNGMSNFKRDSGRANSAVLVDIRPDDFGSGSPTAGIDFQEKYEKLAFSLGNSYKLPKEDYKKFRTNSDIKACLPGFVYKDLIEGIETFGKKIKGFNNDDAMLYALESRSSSPVRIARSENGQAYIGDKEIEGFYPAGEGAGFAGGIMSAASDGVRTALKLLSKEE